MDVLYGSLFAPSCLTHDKFPEPSYFATKLARVELFVRTPPPKSVVPVKNPATNRLPEASAATLLPTLTVVNGAPELVASRAQRNSGGSAIDSVAGALIVPPARFETATV